MKKEILILLVISLNIVVLSCQSSNKSDNQNICGIEMNDNDILNYNNKSKNVESVYEGNGMKLYDIVNDSIRKDFPDSLTFEIFRSFSNEEEIAISVHGPKNKDFMQQVRCAYFNSKYNSEIPEKKYLIIYSYTNPDGSGDSNFEYGLKNK